MPFRQEITVGFNKKAAKLLSFGYLDSVGSFYVINVNLVGFSRYTWGGNVNIDLVFKYLHRVGRDLTFFGPNALAGFHIKFPLVNWTNNNIVF